jgi:singapore isolate B (sub-type 7) whole genome shotgun sequence assembly, scaffold_22
LIALADSSHRLREQLLLGFFAVRDHHPNCHHAARSVLLHQGFFFPPPSFQGLLFLKILLQFLFNVFICFFLMVGLPYYTNTVFGRNPAAIVFFYIQLGYIVASAAQIREGYPNADSYIASMIDNSYSIFNRIIFFVRSSFSQ